MFTFNSTQRAAMHRCLHISEVLCHIFEFLYTAEAGGKSLASLARTCHLFSSPALDVLWHDLYSFHPLLKIFPIATCSVDDPQWLTFRKYAKRVKVFRGRVTAQEFVTSLQRCPQPYLPLLPNLIELEWNHSFLAPNSSGIPLLRYLAGPTVTKVILFFLRRRQYTSAELEALADLPKICPNVTSLAIFPCFLRDCEPPQEAGTLVAQWPRLRSLQICATAQLEPVMNQLLSKKTPESLYIDYYDSSPIYSCTIPDTVRELTLRGDSYSLRTRFLELVYASPTRLRILIARDVKKRKSDNEMFHLLPRSINTSRLLSLTIRSASSSLDVPVWRTLVLQGLLVSALVEFGALHELDLDSFCTAPMSDKDYEYLAGSLTQLRRLKLGTADTSITRPRPVASVGAVIVILRCCEYLETLHILFDGSIPPPQGSAVQDGKLANSKELVCLRRGVNRHITELHVGYSPIGDATVNTMACCLKSIMPRLVQISYTARDEKWGLVQDILRSYQGGWYPVHWRDNR